jgi:prolyl-tRNA editing enzyme YbaK/EbsC (Cys-tRNA(Pro) deacylase)
MNEGFERVAEALAARGHPHAPRWLDAAVLVIASGDRRVDERRVAALTGALARADAAFVKQATGFSIGGVAPLAHARAPVTLIDRELFRFGEIWAAAGHPNGVFRLAPQDLAQLTGGAPVADVVEAP